jgi:hypothetical protein
MLPVSVHDPETGSKISAGVEEPATRTLPSARRVAVWVKRGMIMSPVGAQIPVTGSYISALARVLSPSYPPATRIRPSRRRVAV